MQYDAGATNVKRFNEQTKDGHLPETEWSRFNRKRGEKRASIVSGKNEKRKWNVKRKKDRRREREDGKTRAVYRGEERNEKVRRRESERR